MLIDIILHDLRVGHSPPISCCSLNNVIADTLERKDHHFFFAKNCASIVDPKSKQLRKACVLAL